jgi:hypothetical protein
MFKDKVEQPNYSELCEKALKFVIDGIELPKIKKTPAEEAADMFTKTFLFGNPLQDALKELKKGDLPKTKEDELKELANKNLKRLVTYKDIPCYICGYSVEFDCLIAGAFENSGNGILLGDNDCVLHQAFYNRYFYVPKDIVKE